MARDEDARRRLLEALTELAEREAPDLMQEAVGRARERALHELTDALSEAMVAAVLAAAQGSGGREAAANPAPSEPPVSAPPGPTAVYVYGVVGRDAGALAELPPGVDGSAPVREITERALTALVSDVALADFDEERLREHLVDMQWVERTARCHELVLEAIAAAVTVIPMRMCTVYGSDDGVRELLREQAGALGDALAHLAGKTEWGVKVFAARTDPGVVSEPAGTEPGAPREATGAAYMQRRRSEREVQARVTRELEAATASIHERLSALAAEHVIAPLQRAELSDRAGQMVLNGVYLVPDRAARDFQLLVQECRGDFAALGLELEQTGPWPAYHFIPGTIGVAW